MLTFTTGMSNIDPDRNRESVLLTCFFYFRQIFDVFENDSHLCRRFTVFVTKYNLMSKDNLIVPMLEADATAPGGESEA